MLSGCDPVSGSKGQGKASQTSLPAFGVSHPLITTTMTFDIRANIQTSVFKRGALPRFDPAASGHHPARRVRKSRHKAPEASFVDRKHGSRYAHRRMPCRKATRPFGAGPTKQRVRRARYWSVTLGRIFLRVGRPTIEIQTCHGH